MVDPVVRVLEESGNELDVGKVGVSMGVIPLVVGRSTSMGGGEGTGTDDVRLANESRKRGEGRKQGRRNVPIRRRSPSICVVRREIERGNDLFSDVANDFVPT